MAVFGNIFLLSFLVGFLLAVDYNKLVRWEKRTLRCRGLLCTLDVGAEDGETIAKCREGSVHGQFRHSCFLSCKGADRDSVISKIPSWNHRCVRFSSYDTQQEKDDWMMWREGKCAQQNISLEVHCGFPIGDLRR